MTTVEDKKIELGFGRKPTKRSLSALGKWKQFSAVAHDYAHLDDQWGYIVDKFPTEKAIRWRYDVNKKEFFSDEVEVKIDNEPFAHGAMRQCFRGKKLSKFTSRNLKNPENDWYLPFANIVAKEYFNETDREAYFDDVRLQMDAKFWSEEYDKAGPPKKIDIMQMMIIELIDRPGKPIYHVETVIEGDYVKYNSNSGFVEHNSEHVCRNTPQAFSHFTFEASGHKLMVVDVQGVGDIYTDPQIHTYNGEEYGSGNLATKGMSLFFNTHRCNVICEALGLSKFDLTSKERKRTNTFSDGFTCMRSSVSMSSVESDKRSEPDVFDSGIEDSVEKKDRSASHNIPKIRLPSSSLHLPEEKMDNSDHLFCPVELSRSHRFNGLFRRPTCVVGATQSRSITRTNSMDLDGASKSEKDERATILGQMGISSRDRHVQHQVPSSEERRRITYLLGDHKLNNPILLYMIHYDLALYHYMGRFEDDKSADVNSTLFHLKSAADCGLCIAEFTLACLHLNIYHDDLKELELSDNLVSESEGFAYMEKAAKHGNLTAILKVAQAYHLGYHNTTRDWEKAEKYYRKYAECSSGSTDLCVIEPAYQILGKLAEMFQEGGYGLPKNPLKSGYLYTEAAEAAMASANGRLANRWFMLAEEVWADCEDEEEGAI